MEWIRVSDSKPFKWQTVIITREYEGRFGAQREVLFNVVYNELKDVFIDDYGEELDGIIAWMPAPLAYRGN